MARRAMRADFIVDQYSNSDLIMLHFQMQESFYVYSRLVD